MSEINHFIDTLISQRHLKRYECARLLQIIFLGGASPAQIASAITAMTIKGETNEEVLGGFDAIQGKLKLPIAIDRPLFSFTSITHDSDIFKLHFICNIIISCFDIAILQRVNTLQDSHQAEHFLANLGFILPFNQETGIELLQQYNFGLIYSPSYQKLLREIKPVLRDLQIQDTIFEISDAITKPAQSLYQFVTVSNQQQLELMIETYLKHEIAEVFIGFDEYGIGLITPDQNNNYKIHKISNNNHEIIEIKDIDSLGTLKERDLQYTNYDLRNILKGVGPEPLQNIIYTNIALILMLNKKANNITEALNLIHLLVTKSIPMGKLQDVISHNNQRNL